ncbi:MAG: response regulator transcription factor [Chloroflexota bacterium]|nr:response regulator transcription factor [Chloroflexota bacterium]
MAAPKTKPVRLYVAEEQEIYRGAYKYILPPSAPVELLGMSTTADASDLGDEVAAVDPDVLMVGTKTLDEEMIAQMQTLRTQKPRMGIVLLLVSYTPDNVRLLRELAVKGSGGVALFLKQSIDHVEQLLGIILAASRGQVILDPALISYLFAEKPEYPFLKELTTRELEILSLLSKGYTNAAIAEELYIDVKTVEHHINSMYAKLKAEANFDNRHARVSAARLYLEAMGELVPPVMQQRITVPAYATW